MKIGFDAKRAFQNSTGLGNYSRFILSLLAQYASSGSYLLLQPSRLRESLLPSLPENFVTRTPRWWFWRWLSSLWRTFRIPSVLRREGVQLYHGLSAELPFTIARAVGCRTVVTVHDLIYLRFPQYYRSFDRFLYRLKLKYACRVADSIVAVSECTKRDLVSFLGVAPERVSVLYQGCDGQFRLPASAELRGLVRETYDLPQRFILYVGTIEPRKNLLLLAQALELMESQLPVVALGRQTVYAKEVKAFLASRNLSARMFFYSGVPFAHLPAFYQMADVFVYPSRFEGFGIPVLEAICSGTPVVGATGSCLEEAGGPHSLYVDPDSPQELAHAIDSILTDEILRASMIEKGYQYAERFTDENLAQELLAHYAAVLGEPIV